MTGIKQVLVDALIAVDDSRPRTLQTELGPSSVGHCKAKSVFQLLDYPECNPNTLRLPAIMGTAIHATIEDTMKKHHPDRYLLEAEYPGVPGLLGPSHVDCYDKIDHEVIDWKTTAKKNLRYFPKLNQRWQTMIYGESMIRAGYPVKTVTLVAIARDGTEDDIKVHSEPYDERIAGQAYDWQRSVVEMAATGEIPEPEHSGKICTDYCPFYGPVCPGK